MRRFLCLWHRRRASSFQCEIGSVDEEDGFLLYSYGRETLPEGILQGLDPDTCVRKLEIMLPATPVFNMAFRYNSGRALMMGVRKTAVSHSGVRG